MGHNLVVYYEENRLKGSAADANLISGAHIKKIPSVSIAYFVQVIKQIRKARAANDRVTVYVHDSGFIGLIICAICTWGKRSGDKVIFDYHDSLEWELYHHSRKVTWPGWIGVSMVTTMRLACKYFLKNFISVDLIVGISNSQIEQLKNRFGIRAGKELVIPNTRNRVDVEAGREGPAAILWIGNISQGRRFELAFDLQARLNAKFKNFQVQIIIAGKRYNHSAESSIKAGHVIELGAFNSDMDIVSMTKKWKTIGIFFGWDDPHKTEINAISSVNKIYSYVNTVTPFLLPADQINMIESLGIPQAFLFKSNEECAQKFEWISNNYLLAQKMVMKIKHEAIWDAGLLDILEAEFDS